MMSFFDRHPDVIKWYSEEFVVPYRKPGSDRVHRYFPDFVVRYKTKDAQIKTVMIEVKPASQIEAPKNPNRKNYIKEVYEWEKNQAKWNAAREYCARRGWTFELKDEYDIGVKPRKG